MKIRFPKGEEFLYLCSSKNKHLDISKRYRCLRRSLLLIMLLITSIPLCVTAGLSFFQYKHLTEEETENNIRWHTESARRSLEVFLDRLKDSMVVVFNSYSVQDLATQQTLDKVFSDLKSKHQGLVDLSIIGPDGIQLAYSGPYNLRGKSYADSPWYNKALSRRVFVSEVFLGFRNVPHFVVAVSKREQNSGYWVFRASIDTDTLDSFLASITTDAADDIFLVNQEGKLQSTSRNYGRINDTFPLANKSGIKSVTVFDVRSLGGTVLQALAPVQSTPWHIVLEQQNYSERRAWTSFKNQLLTIFIITSFVAAIIIFRISESIASRVRDADETRDTLLAESEHTSKLASLGRLAAGVAHEINNPLAIINEKAGLMKDLLILDKGYSHREKFLQQLDSLEDAVKRARTITHRLLGFARRMDIRLEQVQVNDVLREVLGFLEKEALYRDIKIDLSLQEDLPTIQSDQGQLQQIFLNIVNNAIDAIGKAGRIEIATSKVSPRAILIEIADNGPGIDDETLNHIFEPFFTTKKQSDKPGTGLGLSITYGLVKKLGGEIAVASTLGTGTTFSISFPIKPINPAEFSNG